MIHIELGKGDPKYTLLESKKKIEIKHILEDKQKCQII